MSEVKISECGPTEWEWRVWQVGGTVHRDGMAKDPREGRYSGCSLPAGRPHPSDTGFVGDTEEVNEL
jgi:hypothetical protein